MKRAALLIGVAGALVGGAAARAQVAPADQPIAPIGPIVDRPLPDADDRQRPGPQTELPPPVSHTNPGAVSAPPPEAFPTDEIPIPGNHAISDTERRQRHDEIFRPYHASIAAELDRRAAQHRRTIVASLHSFTPSMGGISRPWTFGVLHGYDCAFSDDVLAELQRRSPQSVGDNEPYALNAQDYTVPLHAQKRGLDSVEVEVRQDTIRKARDQSDVAATLAEVFQYALTRRAA